MINTALRWAVRLPATLIRSTTNTFASSKSSDSRSGIRAKLIGWPPSRLDPSKDTAWLDGLRGIAALLVMSYHFNVAFIGLWAEAPYGSTIMPQEERVYDLWRLPFFRFFLISGHSQVSVFFVLSGIVLSWKSLDLIRQGRNEQILNTVSSAVVRRWFRLYLPCFGAAILPWIRFRLEGQVPPGTTQYSNIFHQFWDYILACEEFGRPLVRDRKYPNWLHRYSWVVWTIPLEFEGSMLVFVTLVAIARIKDYTKRLLILGMISLYSCILGLWTYWLFATGMLIADYVKESGGFHQLSHNTTSASRFLWWSIFVVGIWMGAIPNPSPKFYNRPGYEFLDGITPAVYKDIEDGARFWWSVAGILIILASCHLRRVQIIFESSLARYFGRISFMLYVTHDDLPKNIGLVLRGWYSGIWGTKVWNDIYGKYLYEYNWLPGLILFILSWISSGIPAIILGHWCEILIDQPSVTFARWLELRLIGDGNVNSSTERHQVVHAAENDDAIALPVYRNSNSNDG